MFFLLIFSLFPLFNLCLCFYIIYFDIRYYINGTVLLFALPYLHYYIYNHVRSSIMSIVIIIIRLCSKVIFFLWCIVQNIGPVTQQNTQGLTRYHWERTKLKVHYNSSVYELLINGISKSFVSPIYLYIPNLVFQE